MIDYDWDEHRGTGKPRNTFGPCKPEEAHQRPAQSKPPCAKCPKQSPQQERQHVLTRQNWLTFRLAMQIHATGGHCLTDEMARDSLLMENVTRVCEIIAAYERQDAADRIAIKTFAIHRKQQ